MTHLTRRRALGLIGACSLGAARGRSAPLAFQPTWESLKQYRCPEWFRDAKLGVFLHWGPMSVPGVDAWYARNMYMEGSKAYRFHLQTYGHPSKFGYKDIIPLWKAEKFDPDYLVGVFKKAGARYIVPVAVHHDNFDCWNSKRHRWNSVNMGPRKDIVVLWREATLKQGLRFGVSEHLERAYSWLNTSKGSDNTGPHAGVPYDGNDPRYREFYLEPHDDTNPAYPRNPPESWKRAWLARITDLVDSYQPDLLYTDGGVPFGAAGLSLIAHFYNANRQRHGGRLEAVYNIKNFLPRTDHGEFQEGMCVEDLERGVLDRIKPEPWQTDTCIGDWFYYTEHSYKTVRSVVHTLVDIVSKNGNLLLNIPLKPEGDLDADAARFLREFSDWMAVNSEALHGTRPWWVFGAGPTRVAGGQFAEAKTEQFTSADIRFTSRDGVLYAIALGWPAKELLMRSLAEGAPHAPRISRVQMLGVKEPLKWSRTGAGLRVEMPPQRPCDHAFALRLSL